MARIVVIDDPRDPRLTDYIRLRDVQLRKSIEAEHGLFLAEGEKVIRRAVAAGYPVRSFLLTPRAREALADVVERADAPVYLVDAEATERIAGFPIHRGSLASMDRLPTPSVADVVNGARRLIVLEDLVDHVNVGAIFRCAAALGIDGVILAPRCTDPLYRRSVKVSMGAVFTLPYARMTHWYDGLKELRAAGFSLLALTPAAEAVALADALPAAGERCALLLGAEGDGLSARWIDEADRAVTIPMSEAAAGRGVDSLNVTAAAAVACYLLAR